MQVVKISEKNNASDYVEAINECIDEIEETSKSLFEVFIDAYKNLTTNEFENEFMPNIKMDLSSKNKMKKICKSDFIMRNRDKLPSSWANLYVLVTIDESEIQKLIDNGEITTNTTKKKILEFKGKINSPIDEDEYDNLSSHRERERKMIKKKILEFKGKINSPIDEDEYDNLSSHRERERKMIKKKILEFKGKINSPIDEYEYDNLLRESANDDGEECNDKPITKRKINDKPITKRKINNNSITKRNEIWDACNMPECKNPGVDDDVYMTMTFKITSEENFLYFNSKLDGLEITKKNKTFWY